ncbi:DUF6326 family protein [Edaphobacter bradus]|uniref:DUF6326 family protein n=1 Tax=Edaphobacter bradus TaxID=2259016 RepID=UPI0021E07CD7|nr:DUF6326 family protein [Edaphobacter bradus]
MMERIEAASPSQDNKATSAFDDIKIHVKFKLFALWSAVMFFYIYGDYFELYQPGKLQEMIVGRMALGAVSQGVLLGMAAVMAIPSLMVFLSLALPPRVNRWMNIIFGTVYTVIMILAMKGGWHFYVFFALVEITLTTLIVWYAWTWQKQPTR